MSAWFNLKMLGSAALALGIATVSLWPEMASANIVFDFNGTCNPQWLPHHERHGHRQFLTLTDADVYGTAYHVHHLRLVFIFKPRSQSTT